MSREFFSSTGKLKWFAPFLALCTLACSSDDQIIFPEGLPYCKHPDEELSNMQGILYYQEEDKIIFSVPKGGLAESQFKEVIRRLHFKGFSSYCQMPQQNEDEEGDGQNNQEKEPKEDTKPPNFIFITKEL